MNLFETAKSNAENFLIAINKLIDGASFSKHFQATVTEKITDMIYKVSYKNKVYKVSSYYSLNIGEMVWVCVPNNNWDSLFVVSHKGNSVESM